MDDLLVESERWGIRLVCSLFRERDGIKSGLMNWKSTGLLFGRGFSYQFHGVN